MTSPEVVLDGRKIVTTAGTRVQLSDDTTEIASVTVMAEEDNTGKIVVGGDTVVAALATRRGAYLSPGDSITVNTNLLINVWIDSTVSTDGVTWEAEAVRGY